MPSHTSKLIVVCGLSFGGKTTLGDAIAGLFGYEQVDVDHTKVRLFGGRFEDNALDQASWDDIYQETDRQIEAHLRAGRSVVDASRNFRRQEREHAGRLARACGSAFVLVYTDTPVSIAWQRMLRNRRSPTRVDWGDAAFDEV